MLAMKDFEQLFIAIFLNLSNCTFHFVIVFDKASILALSLFRIYFENRFIIAIVDEPLFPDRCWITFDS